MTKGNALVVQVQNDIHKIIFKIINKKMKTKLTESFLAKLKEIHTPKELKIIEAWFSTEKRDVTFRVNTLKTTNEEVEKYLKEKGLKIEKITYLENGYKLLGWKEKDLWDLDISSEGKIYIQWITSQLIWELVQTSVQLWQKQKSSPQSSPKGEEVATGFKVLDLTAAPGSKTSHLSAILNNEWEIVANEMNTIRSEKLNFTIKRQWCKNVEVVKGDARELKSTFLENYFDLIIADLPCSAEWRINLTNEKSYAFLEKSGLNKRNYKMQQDILKNTIALLKVGWSLIYSTCTLDPQENEWIVHYLLSIFKDLEIEDISKTFKHKDIKKYTKTWIKSYGKYIYRKDVEKSVRIFPSVDTEWFFIAKFTKKAI